MVTATCNLSTIAATEVNADSFYALYYVPHPVLKSSAGISEGKVWCLVLIWLPFFDSWTMTRKVNRNFAMLRAPAAFDWRSFSVCQSRIFLCFFNKCLLFYWNSVLQILLKPISWRYLWYEIPVQCFLRVDR